MLKRLKRFALLAGIIALAGSSSFAFAAGRTRDGIRSRGRVVHSNSTDTSSDDMIFDVQDLYDIADRIDELSELAK